jgi:L-rhamnose isomerase
MSAPCCHCGLGALDVHVRARAVAQQLARVESGVARGAKALVLDKGECQCDLPYSPSRYLDSMSIIYSALPADWVMLVEGRHCGASANDWSVEVGSRCRLV